MRKAWRNPRQVIVNQASAEPEDIPRRERLVALLATGLERMLSNENNDATESLDFRSDVSNECVASKETESEK